MLQCTLLALYFFFQVRSKKLTADIQTIFDLSLSKHYRTFKQYFLEEITVERN